MKLKAFKISQESKNWKEFQIYMTKMNIFDLKDYVYVKRINEDYSDLQNNTSWIKLFSEISWIEWEEISNTRLDEVQRKLKDSKLKWVKEYIKEDLWIFPSSVLLWVKKEDNFISFIDNWNNIYDLVFNITKNKKWFFIIDWQHRIYWILNYYVEKIKEEFSSFKFVTKWVENIGDYINYLFNEIWEKNSNYFISKNTFDIPIIIMYEISVNLMVELFADINTSSTKLENDFSTYIYWVATNKDLEKKIFVTIWEKLNNSSTSPLYDRIKLPYDLKDKDGKLLKDVRWNFSKISINPFYVNSLKLFILTEQKNKVNYFVKPFNLLLDNFIIDSEYTKYNSPETLSYLINSLIIIYYWTYNKIKEVYWEDNYYNDEYKFISSSNHFMYLEIIKIIILKLYLNENNKNDFINLFSKSDVINKINSIFDKEISNPLKELYKEYEYFKEWSLKWTWAVTWAYITNQFKIHYYCIKIKDNNLIKNLSKKEEDKIKKEIKLKEEEFKKLIYSKL